MQLLEAPGWYEYEIVATPGVELTVGRVMTAVPAPCVGLGGLSGSESDVVRSESWLEKAVLASVPSETNDSPEL
jgi:hypothetical protein